MPTKRQELILRAIVEAYLESGKPVGSKALASDPGVEWGPSTVRSELAALEDAGYLTHPHTSAGRVPTELGYRTYVDALIETGPLPATTGVGLEVTQLRQEVDEAMRETTIALAQVTDLMALVTAPPLESATIHRVEALLLQPEVVLVIVITSAGGVTKRLFSFETPVDPGLVEWASSYLNETLTGLSVGARMIGSRLSDRHLSQRETSFLASLAPAFSELERQTGETLYTQGAARLLSENHLADLPQADKVLSALEGRASVLRILRSALEQRSVFLWIGDENPQPELRSVSLIGANYGLGHRNLGSVGVLGPLRMDYANAISSVRGAARELSQYFEAVYDN